MGAASAVTGTAHASTSSTPEVDRSMAGGRGAAAGDRSQPRVAHQGAVVTGLVGDEGQGGGVQSGHRRRDGEVSKAQA